MKLIYLLLCVLGTALPLSQFLPWVYQHGINIPLLLGQAFGTSISAFAWLDIVISAIVVVMFIIWEGKRIGMKKRWIPIAGLFTVGVSLGLPLFLLLREYRLPLLEQKHEP